jgi:hypothetical protein
MEQMDQDIICPFCGEKDFDLVGLKIHIVMGWCDVYNLTELKDMAVAKAEGQIKNRT